MFRLSNILILIMISFLIKPYKCKNYTNYALYRGMPVTEEHLKFFRNLSETYEVDFWRPPGNLYKPVDFTIHPDHRANFLREANSKGIYLTTVMKDIQRAFDKQTVKAYIRRNMQSFNWESYFRLDDIYSWLKDLQRMYANDMKVIEIGRSFEKRRIVAVEIVLNGSRKRSTVIVEGGIHAREWIAPAFVTYMIYKTVTAPHSEDQEWKRIAYTYKWIFMPVVNPDGYEYSHKEDRLWRKNRNKPSVDLNRNFDSAFGTVGVSTKRNSDIYCGPKPLSEPETEAMARLIKNNSDNLEYYIGFHSYGQYIILPYAYTKSHEENFDEVSQLGKKVSKSIYSRFRKKYAVGTAYDTVGYTTSGVSGCWVKKQFKVPYVVTFELRDDGVNGFALPPSQIIQTCQETMDGMKTLLSPQSKNFQKLRQSIIVQVPTDADVQNTLISDAIITFCNILLFLIIRFD